MQLTEIFDSIASPATTSTSKMSSSSPPSSSIVDQSPTPFAFMRLPAELRVMVYGFIFEGGVRSRRADGTGSQKHQLAILRTSKQVHQEALPIAYGNIILQLHGDAYPLTRALAWLPNDKKRHVRFLTCEMWSNDTSDELECIAMLAAIFRDSVCLEKLCIRFTDISDLPGLFPFRLLSPSWGTFLQMALEEFTDYEILRLEGFFHSSFADRLLSLGLKPIPTADSEGISVWQDDSPIVGNGYASKKYCVAEMANTSFRKSRAETRENNHEKDE